MSGLCDATDCRFNAIEYVGGESPQEPDMREVRKSENTAIAEFEARNPQDAQLSSEGDSQPKESQLYQAELQRKQSLRSIQYFYRGKPVTAGAFAQQSASFPKH